MPDPNPKDFAKRAAAKAAADLVHEGMLIGLGTGSTASYFIESLIARCRTHHLHIRAVATSERSAKQAKEGGIPLVDINQFTSLDMVVDGADQIDPLKRMIKGGGGALLREKIIASMSREMVVVVDDSKLVPQLGTFPLPVEIATFAHTSTLHRIQQLGYSGKWRRRPDGQLYVTDNGNYIVDITFPHLIQDPELDNQQLRSIVGVLETGLFLNLAGRVLIGHADGRVKIW